MRKPVFGVSDQFPHKPGCTATKMAGGLKLRIWEVEELYYPCSENKGADQLRGHREADLRLCFRICKKPVFSQRGSFHIQELSLDKHIHMENNSTKKMQTKQQLPL